MDINIIKSKFEECKKHFGLIDFDKYASNVINEILAPGGHVNFKEPIFGEFYGVLINGLTALKMVTISNVAHILRKGME